jgi:isopenicillin N synthase-like dioxygenase
MKLNKLKILSVAVCCLVIALWSETQCMDEIKSNNTEIHKIIKDLPSVENVMQVPLREFDYDKLSWCKEDDKPHQIPLIDFHKSEIEQIEVFKSVANGPHCFYLKNHIISEEEIKKIIEITRKLINNIEGKKIDISRSEHQILRGYLSYAQEHSGKVYNQDPNKKFTGDQHVRFMWGKDSNPTYNGDDIEQINFYKEFENVWNGYFDKCNEISKSLIILANKSLGLNLDWNTIKEGDSILKLMDYLPSQLNLESQYRIFPHTDSSFFTLLTQTPARDGRYIGLQMKIEEECVDVPAIKGTMVVNFGEILHALTGGKLKPAEHWVINPNKDYILGSERISIPFFLIAHGDVKLSCPPNSRYERYYNKDGEISTSDFLKKFTVDFITQT